LSLIEKKYDLSYLEGSWEMAKFVIYFTEPFKEWLNSQTHKSRSQIRSRLLKIEDEGYFGTNKFLDRFGIWELKFNDGRRIYYALIPDSKIIVLYGGNKNGQEKDIKKATSILRKIGKT
jgi:putative addiction module killer protein